MFPLSYRLFNNLADRGFSISKILGLLLWGYLYWLGNIFQVLENNYSSTLFIFLLIIMLSIISIRKISFNNIFSWCKSNLRIIIFFESLFLIAFVGWAIIRAANPEIIGTEKPMELAFITSIFRSPAFPPNDPWLSQYSISYYYFGYLVVSMLMRMCGTVAGVAFNLSLAAWFALVAVSSSGILFNFLHNRSGQPKSRKKIIRILLASLLAPMMILIVSNAEGFLELIHSRGIFWSIDTNQQMVSSVWKWVDIKELNDPPPLPLDWLPGRAGGTWWWRASRVLQDYTLDGQTREIIDEFPFFSFLLGDLHPHVLSMPFVLLAIYSGFSLFFEKVGRRIQRIRFTQYLGTTKLWFSGFVLGILLFVNTWDFPIYFGLFVLIRLFQLIEERGINRAAIKELVLYSISLGAICILLYFPFILGLSTQAGGFLPSLIFKTRGIHFTIMFFPQTLLIFWFLIGLNKTSLLSKKFLYVGLIGISISILILLLSILYVLLPGISESLMGLMSKISGAVAQSKFAGLQNASDALLGIFGSDTYKNLILGSVLKILKDPSVILLLVLLLSLCVMGIYQLQPAEEDALKNTKKKKSRQFILILIALGALLCYFPEFFYLRDQFGWRMNTIFKFYFQSWILFSLAGAFAIYEIIYKVKSIRKKSLSLSLVVLLLSTGFVYPVFSLFEKMNSFRNINWSIDGNYYFKSSNSLEFDAITFLDQVPYGVITEAVGGSYSNFGRISKISGLPTVLGWPGHESQWRGGAAEIGNRESDIKELYATANWDKAQLILERYEIKYVYIGPLEKSTYPVSEIKFNDNLIKIFNNSEVTIFEYSPKS